MDRLAFGLELRDSLPHTRMTPGGPAVARSALGKLDQFRNLLEQSPIMAHRALEHQRGNRDLPALILLADQVFARHPHVVEKNLVEARAPVICTSGRTVIPGVFISTSR